MSVSGKAFDFQLLKRVLKAVRPQRKLLIAAVGITVFLALLSPVRPLLVQYTIDTFVLGTSTGNLAFYAIIMVSVLLVEAFGQFGSSYVSNLLGQSVIRDLRTKVYNHVLSLNVKYFDRNPIGMLITRVVSDIETIASVFTEGIVIVFGDLLQLSVVLIVMFYTDWRLALISISTIPLLLIATNIFKNGIKSAFQDVRTQVARLNTFVQEHISGMSVIQVFSREEEELKKFKAINREHAAAHIRSVWHYSIFLPVVEILSAVSLGLLIWLGSDGVMEGRFTVGNLIAFTMYVNMLFRPIRTLADRFNTLQMGMVSSERVFKLLDETDALVPESGKIIPENLNGDIEFRNIWMAYKDDDWVLRDLSFSVKRGTTVAIVGATGSGKTTIINLVNRFYEYQKGEILLDRLPLYDYDISFLRSEIAVVLQDVFLFSDSIANNISLNNPEITREMIEQAAREVGADEFIRKLPGGYDFNVMERGSMLSAGQRQLIAFIRAYLYNPAILVLDEATSSVDAETEELIRIATEKLTRNRTSIIIAHRLATIQKADQIIVMEKGQVLESGNHQELLAKNGKYRKLYELQFAAEE
ncbi:MAG: ABC transporter ATP-binding protein [Bacteroidia bacterium]|jgi:ATP-binding cassette subfamily B multidrug efflux pump